MYINLLLQFTRILRWIKKSELMNDSLMVGILGGTLGASAMELSNLLWFGKSRSKVSYGRFAASLVVNKFRSTQIKNLLIYMFIL